MHQLRCIHCGKSFVVYGDMTDEELSAFACGNCEAYHSITEKYLIPSVIIYHGWDVRIRLYEHTQAFCASTYLGVPNSVVPLEEEFVSATGGLIQ